MDAGCTNDEEEVKTVITQEEPPEFESFLKRIGLLSGPEDDGSFGSYYKKGIKNEDLGDIKSIEKNLLKVKRRPKIKNWRYLVSLVKKHTENKETEELAENESESEDCSGSDMTYFDGLVFLAKNSHVLKQLASSSSEILDKSTSEAEEKRTQSQPEEEMVEDTDDSEDEDRPPVLIAAIDEFIGELVEFDKELMAYKSTNEVPLETEEQKEPANKPTKPESEEAKGDKYVPKKVDVPWSDPRTDEKFAKELEEFVNFGEFRCGGESLPKVPLFDNSHEEMGLGKGLPRNIIPMLSPASDNQLEDWEYSIMLQFDEIPKTYSLDEIEEVLRRKESTELKNQDENVGGKKKDLPEATQSDSFHARVEKTIVYNFSDYALAPMPPNMEEIVGVRNNVGEVTTYTSRLKSQEHLATELNWMYGLVDEEEEEEHEKDDDPAQQAEELEWVKEKMKENIIGGEGVPDEQLEDALAASIEFFSEICKKNKKSPIPKIEEQLAKELMQSGNQLLGKFHGPSKTFLEESSLEEVFNKELAQFQHIREAHMNKVCPPGKLEALITSEYEEDARFRELSSNIKNENFETISRPAQLHLNLPSTMEDESDPTGSPEEEKSETCLSSNVEKIPEEKSRPLFHDENLIEETEEIEDLHDIFVDSSESSGSIDEYEDSSDDSSPEDLYFDNEFKKEYFRRGGLKEGLGEASGSVSRECESKKTYSEKFFTFPFASPHSVEYDLVRMRRVLAQNFPEMRDVAFADLSKDIDINVSEPDESSSESEDNLSVTLKPFEFEDILHMPVSDKSPYNDESDLLSAEEDLDENYEQISPTGHTYEDLVKEVKSRKKRKRKMKQELKSLSEEEETSENQDTVEHVKASAVWVPIDKFGHPSEEKILDAMTTLHKIMVPSSHFKPPKGVYEVSEPPSNFKTPEGLKEVNSVIVSSSFSKYPKTVYKVPPGNFKTPKGMKEWLRGDLIPSKETLQKWKKKYLDYYSNQSLLDSVTNSEKQQQLEYFMESLEEDLEFNEGEVNLLKKFKMIIEQKKKAREQKNKADEIIESGDLQVEEEFHENEGDKLVVESTSATPSDKGAGPIITMSTADLPSNQQKPLDEQSPFVPNKRPVIHLRDVPAPLKKEDWAEEVDCHEAVEFSFTPAMTYKFELDGFQKQAILALERGYNVFVSAHTSAGKTVVAEYAIAMSKRNRSKAVYTSPVKALSNQKYADFKRIFGSVGLITGDIQLNENAECLIMTTEILRSMLYNSSEKIRDLQFVVFDEVHYINDPERGHVWEEVLILLSSQVQIVMLSATVPNTLEFANWVGRTKQRKVVVCATQHRPVPLNHYLYTGTGGPSPGNTYLLKSADGLFLLNNYRQAESVMKASQERERQNKRKQQMKKREEEHEWKKKGQQGPAPKSYEEEFADFAFKKDQTMWISLISFLEKKDWLPAVSFVFSRRKCDAFAEMLSTVDLTTKPEKSFIHKFIKSQVEKLDEIDQDLPQIQIMRKQLDRGIGVHHSGILPVMKEIVEVLFQEGKVKLLFATETFAMGVNMPARSVIFHSIKKFDGNDTRLLLPAEYVQMAGRAGRRGKDAAGNVIILAKPNDLIPRNSLETLLFGNPCKLISKFRLTFRMILNTLTVSGMLTVQNMMERSYCENQGQLNRKFLQKDLIDAESKEKILKSSMLAKVSDLNVEIMSKFFDDASKFIYEWNLLRVTFLNKIKALRDIYPGRLLKICIGSYVNRTCLLLETQQFTDDPSRNLYKVLVLNQTTDFERSIAPDGHDMSQDELQLWYRMVSLLKGLPLEVNIISGPTDYTILQVKCNNIVAVYKETMKLHKNQLEEFVTSLRKAPLGFRNKSSDEGDNIAMVLYSHTTRTTEVNERSAVNEDFDLALKASQMWSLLDLVEESTFSLSVPLAMESFRRVFRWKQALSKVEKLRYSMSVENMTLYPDFVSKISLLKDKGYISSSEQVLMKGYMAARVGKYELLVCELLVENVLVDLTPEEVAALLSFLVYQSSADDGEIVDKTLPPSLEAAIKKCKQIMTDITELEKHYGIRDFEGSDIGKLKFGLVPIMYAWAKQEPLKKIMEMPIDFQEGMLVRWIQQLLETLKEVEAAARLMGDPGVPAKLQTAGQSIKRGIVFAPSLYTTML